MAYLLDLLPLALDESAGDLLERGLGCVEGSVCLEVRLYQLLDVEVECVHADVVLAQRHVIGYQGPKGYLVHTW